MGGERFKEKKFSLHEYFIHEKIHNEKFLNAETTFKCRRVQSLSCVAWIVALGETNPRIYERNEKDGRQEPETFFSISLGCDFLFV